MKKSLSKCPTCGKPLKISQYHCSECEIDINGEFEGCMFCNLGDEDRYFALVFLQTGGNIKDVERVMGISYPTVKAKLATLLRNLGVSNGGGSGCCPDDDRVIELMDDDYPEEEVEDEKGRPRKKKRPRFLIIEVSKGGSKKVNVRIPLKLARIASRFIPKHAHAQMKAHGMEGNLNELLAGLEELEPGEDLINVNDEDDDEQVRIYTI